MARPNKGLIVLAKGAPFQIGAVLAVALAILWFLSIRIGGYFYRTDIYQEPDLYNLTKAGVHWDTYYGQSPMCGNIECFATSGYPAQNYQKKMVLPAREFPLNDYVRGQRIYLRAHVEIPEKILAAGQPIAFHSLYIWAKTYKFYVNDTLFEEGESELLNVTIPHDVVPKDRVVNLAFVIDPGDLPYQGLANRRDILIGAKSALKRTAFDGEELKTTFYLWFLLPKLTFCLMFSLVFLFLSRTKLLFMFIGYTFLSGLETFFDSGYSTMMLPAGDFSLFGPIGRDVASLFFIGFLVEYFGAGRVTIQRYLAAAAAALIAASSIVFFLVSQNVALKALDAVHAVVYPSIFLFAGFKARRNKQLPLAFFFFASLIPGMIQAWHMASDLLGLNMHLGVAWHWIHDLVMFLVLTALAIIDIGKSLLAKVLVEDELQAVNERLELGRTVQSMLLPTAMEGEVGGFAYKYYYEPAEKMSGDWLSIWQGDGINHLFMGDVVGKGPQAALAVAAISSIINDSKHHNLSISECIERINCQLIDLFRKHITSTISSITMHGDGSVEFHSAASLGWFALHGNKVQHLAMRSMPLGVAKNVPLATVRKTFEPGTILFTFTDGCLEGSRAMKTLFGRLRALPEGAEMSFDELHRTILELGKEHVLVDDKTVLIVRVGEPQTMRGFQAG